MLYHAILEGERRRGAKIQPPPAWLMPVDQRPNSVLIVRYGLPLRSHQLVYETGDLHGRWDGEPDPAGTIRIWKARGSAGAAAAAPYDGLVPLSPRWRPFVINSLFWASISGALWFGAGAARQWNRARCGLCRHCGYSLEGMEGQVTCPECGTVARVRSGSSLRP